jgi:hypothetical protein
VTAVTTYKTTRCHNPEDYVRYQLLRLRVDWKNEMEKIWKEAVMISSKILS